jgi:hypothetical protein
MVCGFVGCGWDFGVKQKRAKKGIRTEIRTRIISSDLALEYIEPSTDLATPNWMRRGC